ncbi:DNA-directed RNA polymerase [Veillonella sp.]|uniref:DNA-directed RNA polymerase n=1 Tax=Veillonella sp. TaxID=1926307 RepID=UPI0025F429AD|nr:DNA-directed RNA polymerase [Veillonella sp.]
MSNTLEDQIKLERQYKEYAKELFIQRHEAEQEKGRGAHTRVGKGLLNYVSESLATSIEAWITEELKPRRGVQPTYKKLLQALETAVGHEDLVLNACAFTFESAINSVISGDKYSKSISSISGAIGKTLYYECKLTAFMNQLESHYQKGVINEQLKKRNLLRYKWNYIKEVTDSEDFKFYVENEAEVKSLGVALIDIFVSTTGLVEYTQDGTKSMRLTPTKSLVEIWKKNLDNISTKANLAPPTIIPPKKWTSLDNGAYYDVASQYSVFMRLDWDTQRSRTGRNYIRKLAEVDLSQVMKAVNAIQETAYKVNKRLLKAVNYLVSIGGERAGIERIEPIEIPPELTGDYSEDELKRHKELIKELHNKERARMSKALRLYKIVNYAKDFSEYEKIYFPCNIDFRGRIYPIPFFNFQGDDLMKSLLLYAEPVACSHEEDLRTLKIQGSNLWGNDKIGYKAQCEWIDENTDKILLTAEDYLASNWWEQADEPLQFLAFCYEYADCLKYLKEHNGSIIGYTCSIPIAFDGTCSGLQHYSAMLLDPVGGNAVNLTSGHDKPEDIYQQVADGVLKLVQEDALTGTPDEYKTIKNKFKTKEGEPETVDVTVKGTKTLAQAWLAYGITRKVCKRPVMTLAYGSGEYGFSEQLFEDIARHSETFKGIARPASKYLAKLIAQVVKDVVVSAVSGMAFLKKLAIKMNEADIPVNWWTPLGLPVQQNYLSMEKKYIKTRLGATKRVRIYYDEPTPNEEVDKNHQRNGVAPNFIHSLDSTHLMLVVNEAGLKNYTTIHDSFGTSLGETLVLKRVLREQLYKLYTEYKPLETFKEYVEQELNKKLPDVEIPEKGNLDLSEIFLSDYVFH